MSFGKLLAAGRSLMGGQDGASRYRMGKHSRLPKFISPKNPFANASQRESLQPEIARSESETTAKVEALTNVAAAPQQARSISNTTTTKANAQTIAGSTKAKFKFPEFKFPSPGGMFNQAWQKLSNFVPRKAKSSGAGRKISSTEPVQAELRLENVQVVRNDLSDSDLEVVAAVESRPAGKEPVREPAMAEPVGAGGEKNWSRLATRFFSSSEK